MYTAEDYKNSTNPSWCKGCSFHSVLQALMRMLSIKNVNPSEISIISGIGCSSRLPLFMNCFGMHTLHGRAIPIAVGASLARPEIPVIVTAGDGDLFSIGIGHFIHAALKNINITVLCLDNQMFAMTKNQSSPTSPIGHQGTLTPQGKIEPEMNILELAYSCNASFIARTIFSNTDHMTTIFQKAFEHEGFSFVHVVAPCNTFDSGRISNTIDINIDLLHNPTDRIMAQQYTFQKSFNNQYGMSGIPIGIFLTQNRQIYNKQ